MRYDLPKALFKDYIQIYKLLFALLLFFPACKNPPVREKKGNLNGIIDTTMVRRAPDPVVIINYDSIKTLVVKMKAKFIERKDDFQKVTWYTHKRFGKYWPNRKTLVVHIRNDGFWYLESNYWDSEDWCFHEKAIVAIDGEVRETPIVQTFSDNHRSDNKAYNLWEVNQYTDGDNGITEWIAANVGKTIKVRFEGDKNVSDVTLSDADKIAIKQSLEFADLLKKTK